MAKLRRTHTAMKSYLCTLSAFLQLPFAIQWRTFLVQLPRYVPLSILHLTSPEGPHPFVAALPSRDDAYSIPIYVFVPPSPASSPDDDDDDDDDANYNAGPRKLPVHLDFHGGGFIMGSPLEQAPFCALLSRTLGAVVISVSYRLGPLHQFPAAIHDAEDVLAAVLDSDGATPGGRALRAELQRHYSMQQHAGRQQEQQDGAAARSSIELDPAHLSISGFSAGGNLALNLALSVPTSDSPPPSPPASPSPSSSSSSSSSATAPDVSAPWPSLLPFPTAHPTLIPLLLFYPSLDARLPHHQRPLPPSMSQEPRVPGLFSILGPTYLPQRFRAHPRASPGLANPLHALHRNVSIFLVLPERDSLAVQSQVWVGKMREAGWSGPVRKGDGDEKGDVGGETEGKGEGEGRRNGGLEVWHAPGCRHGWTQFPESWLGKHEKAERRNVFARTVDFVREGWGG